MTLRPLDLPSMEYLCLNLREVDWDEARMLVSHDNRWMLAWNSYHFILNNGRAQVAWHNGRPAGMCAFTENWTGVWQVWSFGTDDYPKVAIELARWFRREAREILSVCKGIRLQCDSRIGHPDAHRYIRAFGGQPEGPPMASYGKDGSAYQRYVWLPGVNDAVLKPHFGRVA
jgi:hypothetical protein